MELQESLAAFREEGAEVVAISSDDEAALRAFARTEGVEFPLLLDPEGSVFRDWGILAGEDPPLPHPTVVVVGQDGRVAARWTDENYRERPPASDVLDAVRSTTD